jgi:uncharacterized protein (DUF4415 family)
MKQIKRVTKKRKAGEIRAGKAGKVKSAGSRKAAPRGSPREAVSLMASGEEQESAHSLIEQFYKPLKKPVTLRLDADVLAWFKRPGRRYQTRINRALREIMKREMDDFEE